MISVRSASSALIRRLILAAAVLLTVLLLLPAAVKAATTGDVGYYQGGELVGYHSVWGCGDALYISASGSRTYVCTGGYYGSSGATEVSSWPTSDADKYIVCGGYGDSGGYPTASTSIFMKSGAVGALYGGNYFSFMDAATDMLLVGTSITVSGGRVGTIYGRGMCYRQHRNYHHRRQCRNRL